MTNVLFKPSTDRRNYSNQPDRKRLFDNASWSTLNISHLSESAPDKVHKRGK